MSKTYGFGTSNNGNIQTIIDNLSSGRPQNFTYDQMNRLTAASTTATTGSDAWNETYTIDPWSNLKQSGTFSFSSQTYDSNNKIALTGFTYDSAGNVTNDTYHGYAYDAEGRMKSVDTTVATYTYAADGQRTRVDAGSGWTEYVHFGGLPIAEKSSAGDWTDYIYAGGQRIAKTEALDRGLRIFGTNSAASQYSPFYLANAGGLNGYTIRSGDKLYLTQYQLTGTKGGMQLRFTDGSNSNWGVKDQDGYYLNDDQIQTTTHLRTIDLSALAGKTINNITLDDEADTAAGSWAIIYEQITILSVDGKVQPIYTGQSSSPVSSITSSTGVTGTGSQVDINRGKQTHTGSTTTFYTGDHLGSARIVASGNGYPVWSGVFLPFGQELTPQITANHYKFTGDEHDSESNLEHTEFRQLADNTGPLAVARHLHGQHELSKPTEPESVCVCQQPPMSYVDPMG